MGPPRVARLRVAALTAAVGLPLVMSSCASSTGSGPVELVVWAHDGTEAESAVLQAQVEDFNSSQDEVEVTLALEAEGSYNDALQAAASGGNLPDVAEIDGPLLASYVYQEVLVPLDGLVDQEMLDDQLPSLKTQGEFNARAYAVGVFDSGLGLYADRRSLDAAGVRWPRTIDEAWTAEEFADVLAVLARRDPDRKVLDVKANYGAGEWLTYGFSPLVSSAGGSLLDPETLSAVGRMDGRGTVRALSTLRSWARYVDPNDQDDAFVDRRVPLSWVGHWVYRDYVDALGDDLLVLPLPDLGNGSKTGQGSWSWTVTAKKPEKQRAAARFLEFLLSEREVQRMVGANGAVPGTRSALDASELYAVNGPLRLLAQQLLRSCGNDRPSRSCTAVPRPRTPGYVTLSSQFAQAVAAALGGKDPLPVLATGVGYVEDDLRANDRFGSR